MRSYLVALGLLFIALCHPSFAQTPAVSAQPTPAPATDAAAAAAAAATAAAADTDTDDEPLPIFMFDLNRPFALNCSPAGGVDAASITFTWQKNGTAVELVSDLTGRYKLEEEGAVLAVTRALEDDYGNYTCAVGGAAALRWRVHARPIPRLPPNSNVVEGQKLKLTCKIIGKPYPAVTWTYKEDEFHNETDVETRLGERVNITDSAAGVPRGELVVAAAADEDAGVYVCRAPGAAMPAATTLRVKDMYAALWPFLGICAEVFVLCAIILVYEKRRTKPELDDSDTDNHDQKKS